METGAEYRFPYISTTKANTTDVESSTHIEEGGEPRSRLSFELSNLK